MSSLRDRLTYRPGMTRRRPKLYGAILLAGLALVLYAGYTKHIPFTSRGGQVIEAEFSDATHAYKGSEVRIRGIDVGKVESVRRRDDGGAIVTMRLKGDPKVDLRAGARAQIYQRTLLGRNVYVELQPGTKDAPKLSGPIALRNTDVQQEVDQAIEPLDGDRRKGLQETVDEMSRAMIDPDAAGDAIDASGPASRAVRQGLPGFRGTTPGDLSKLLREGADTLKAVGRSDEALAGLIDNGRTALGVTAAQSGAISSALAQTPATLADTRTTLRRLETTLDTLDPTADALRPGARALKASLTDVRPAFRRLDVVLDDAEPTIRDLSPAVKRLADASDPGRQLFERLEPIVDRLNGRTLPFLSETHSTTKLKNYEAIGPFFAALGGSSHTFDANGNVQNFQSFPSERSLQTIPCVLRLTDPSAAPSEKVTCSSLGDTLAQILQQKAPSTLKDYKAEDDPDVGDKPQDLAPATPGGGGKVLRSTDTKKGGR